MHYIYTSFYPSPSPVHTPTHMHTISQPLTSLSLSQSLSTLNPPKIISQSASEDVSSKKHHKKHKSSTASNACGRVRVAQFEEKFELWERTAVWMWAGRLLQTRRAWTENDLLTKALKFPSCKRKTDLFTLTGTESVRSVYRETWWQVRMVAWYHQRNWFTLIKLILTLIHTKLIFHSETIAINQPKQAIPPIPNRNSPPIPNHNCPPIPNHNYSLNPNSVSPWAAKYPLLSS